MKSAVIGENVTTGSVTATDDPIGPTVDGSATETVISATS
jgi:hypothetical protein